jgi:hypothetical protein
MQRFRNVSVLAGVLLCLSVAVCPVWGIIAINTSQQTFILSNEGGGLVTQLVNAGYGTENIYQALVDIVSATNPSVAGTLTPAFLQALFACPPSCQIFTTQLSSLNVPGAAYAISTDGTVQTVSIFGSTYKGQAGTATLVSNISGVGPGSFTYSTTSSPLTSFTVVNGGLGLTTTYNVFGIAWAPSQAPSQPPAMVPALSPLALILLAAGLCAAAMYLMRKRMAGFDVKP